MSLSFLGLAQGPLNYLYVVQRMLEAVVISAVAIGLRPGRERERDRVVVRKSPKTCHEILIESLNI